MAISLKGNQTALELRASFETADFQFEIEADWDLHRDSLQHATETLTDARTTQNLFRRVTTMAVPVTRSISFGPLLRGLKTLSLRAEGPPGIHYITGLADGQELVPIRIEGCHCAHPADEPIPTYAWSRGTVRPIEVQFDPRINQAGLADLGKVIRKEVAAFRLSPECIVLAAVGKCFWGYTACAAAEIACLASIGASGVGAVACVAAALACAQAVNESHGKK